MATDTPTIISFENQAHREPVIALWQEVFGYETAHNEPHLVIDKKLAVNDGLFFLAMEMDNVIGSVMAGYDGHRGWIYSLAVLPFFRKRGIGTALLSHAEKQLSLLGCMKINLQIVEGNEAVGHFYRVNGYSSEKRISMGKRLPENIKRSF